VTDRQNRRFPGTGPPLLRRRGTGRRRPQGLSGVGHSWHLRLCRDGRMDIGTAHRYPGCMWSRHPGAL